MNSILLTIALSVIASFIYEALRSGQLRALYDLLLNLRSTKKYYSLLERSFMHMPFIYQHLELKTIDDYVDITSHSIDIDKAASERIGKKGHRFSRNIEEQLKDSKKVFILGGAGVGKTTYVQRKILDLVEQGSDTRWIHEREKNRILPIYIPFKSIFLDGEEYPLVRHLLKLKLINDKKLNIDELITLADSRRLFMILDGFDERLADEGGHLEHELEAIYAQPSSSLIDKTDKRELLLSIISQKSRVWLSSRLEFFEDHRFRVSSKTYIALVLEGVNEPIRLVDNIFSLYPNAQREKLDSQELISTVTSGQANLSPKEYENPLFLTILTYHYASSILSGSSDRIAGINLAIEHCIRLLLEDLDSEKVRGLPESSALLIAQGRSHGSTKIKTNFLRYFSYFLIFESVGVFNRTEIEKNLEEFIKNKDFEHFDISKFVDHLIYSGIFVWDRVTVDPPNYDFPHRRFRETLCISYLDDIGFSHLVQNFDRAEVSELCYLYTRNSKFNYDFIEDVLENITDFKYEAPDVALDTFSRCLDIFEEKSDTTPSIKQALERIRSAIDLKSNNNDQKLHYLLDYNVFPYYIERNLTFFISPTSAFAREDCLENLKRIFLLISNNSISLEDVFLFLDGIKEDFSHKAILNIIEANPAPERMHYVMKEILNTSCSLTGKEYRLLKSCMTQASDQYIEHQVIHGSLVMLSKNNKNIAHRHRTLIDYINESREEKISYPTDLIIPSAYRK